ncbi:MAG: M50 family metallopeptidase [Chloroflexota bacterium]|nr:M50 family metallopeptidase [Chloroflexota bacterium]
MSGILSIFTNLQTLVLFIATFTLIVAVHEFGHFAAARLLGMKVLEFAFGFPPRLAGIRRGETEYTLNWIPFGGFVRILGQDDFTIHQRGTGDPRSFTSKPWWAQAIVLAAGVFMNFVLAILILTVAFMTGTTAPTGDVRVFDVRPGSPAQAAGLQVGDIVVDVDGAPVHTARAMVNITAKAADKQQQITIDITRNGQPVAPIKATPRAEPPAGEGPLGVQLEEVQAAISVPLGQAISSAVSLTGDVVGQIVALPGQLLAQRAAPAGGAPVVGGPIEIFRVTGQVAQFGIPTFLKLVGVLSVNLGVINIIPFPGLDGGRLFFVLLGAILRRRLSPQVEAAIHAVGFVLLLGLLVIVSISDIRRAIGG